MTVAYPIQNQNDYTELRYSLRSIEKHISQPFEVVIVGDKLPDWITNITHISLPDFKGRKQLSIRAKIYAALQYSDEIYFMNDDVYLLQPPTFNYYYHGSLGKYTESGSKPLQKQLESFGKTTKHFDGHYPLVYNQGFKEVMENFTPDCIIKSAYCNYLGIEGVQIADCKLIKATKPEQIREFIKTRPCLSTGQYSLASTLPLLHELFPNKSIFELW